VEALATTAETRTVRELAEPLTRRVPEPSRQSGSAARYVRGLNPLAELDAALLTAISDPRWVLTGLRNRDLVAELYPTVSEDARERRRRSARVTRICESCAVTGCWRKSPAVIATKSARTLEPGSSHCLPAATQTPTSS